MNGTGFRIDLLKQILDAASLRHQVIANNVANVNTPGYHSKEVAFEDEMARALAIEQCGSKPPHVQPRVVETEGLPERVDGNNVNIDREMSDLTKNALLYEAAAQIMASRISQLRAGITGQ